MTKDGRLSYNFSTLKYFSSSSFTGVLRSKYPSENVCTIRSRASNVLKRSSGLKGGAAYKAKRNLQMASVKTSTTSTVTKKSYMVVNTANSPCKRNNPSYGEEENSKKKSCISSPSSGGSSDSERE